MVGLEWQASARRWIAAAARPALQGAFVRGAFPKQRSRYPMSDGSDWSNVILLADRMRHASQNGTAMRDRKGQADEGCTARRDGRRQAGGDRTAGRVASAVAEAKRDIYDRLMEANSAAETVRSAERQLQTTVERALEAVYALWYRLSMAPSEMGVDARSAGAPGHEIAQLARLIFGGVLGPAALEACVNLLQLAEEEATPPHEFGSFMWEVCGTAAWMKNLR
jgi:hypothetical protein